MADPKIVAKWIQKKKHLKLNSQQKTFPPQLKSP